MRLLYVRDTEEAERNHYNPAFRLELSFNKLSTDTGFCMKTSCC